MRLNKLGTYILGINNSYQASYENASSNLVFSEDSLIVLAEGDLSINEILLKSFTEKVSTNRFRVTNEVFLKTCENKSDVAKRIKDFKETFGQNLPDNWNKYFDGLLEKSKSITQVKEIKTFQISVNDKELQKLLAQDDILKKYVIKAEHFYIFVKKENFAKFRLRLMDFGYVVYAE